MDRRAVIGTLEGDIKPIRYAVTRERYLAGVARQKIARIPVPTIRIILFKYGSNNSWGELFARPGISRTGISYFLSLSMKNTSSKPAVYSQKYGCSPSLSQRCATGHRSAVTLHHGCA